MLGVDSAIARQYLDTLLTFKGASRSDMYEDVPLSETVAVSGTANWKMRERISAGGLRIQRAAQNIDLRAFVDVTFIRITSMS